MKKLYLNIDRISIKGKPENLHQNVVHNMNQFMKELISSTEEMGNTMKKYSWTNQGNQFQKAYQAVTKLSRVLYDAQENLFGVQIQFTYYINKILKFEGSSKRVDPPRKLEKRVVKSNDVNAKKTEYILEEMIKLKNAIEDYSRKVKKESTGLGGKVDDIGQQWTDPQYKAFKNMIEDVRLQISEGCKELSDYASYLKKIIDELNK